MSNQNSSTQSVSNFDYDQFLPGLRSKDTTVQLKTVHELYRCLANELKRIKREEETSFIDTLIALIRRLGNDRNDTGDKQSCILIITSIINLDNINVRVSKMHHASLFLLLRNLITSSETSIIQMASRAMGRLVMAGAECDVDFKGGLDNLRNEQRRYTGIIVVRELALASPARLFLNSVVFFEDIMLAITDKDAHIRQEACELFRLSLHISISREVIRPDSNSMLSTRGDLSLRRSSTTSSLTNSQDSLHTSIASSVNVINIGGSTTGAQNQGSGANFNDFYFALQYKGCLEQAIKELGDCLTPGTLLYKTPLRDERMHGCLLIILEVLKFSRLEFEKEIEKNISMYITNSQEIENQIKTCQELHAKNLIALLPYSFESINDPFLFLFKSEKITVKVESKNCSNLFKEKENYEKVFACITKLYSHSSIHIQRTLLQLIPRLANFDKNRFTDLYLNECIEYLTLLITKKSTNSIKSEAIFSAGLLSLAVREAFLEYAKKFIEIIRSNTLTNTKENKKKRGSNVSNSSSFASIAGMTAGSAAQQTVSNFTQALQTNTNAFINASLPLTNTINSLTSKYSLYNALSTSSSLQSIASSAATTNDELNSILACVAMFAKSIPTEMSDSILELLEPLMLTSGGVTHKMRYCLDEISRCIPRLSPAIYENLLKIISQILTGKPLCQIIQTISTSISQLTQPVGITSTLFQNQQPSNLSVSSSTSDSGLTQSQSITTQLSALSLQATDKSLILQALQTLRSFDFSTVYVIAFLPYCVDTYLQHESREVKIEAVLTTSTLINRLIRALERKESASLISMISCTLSKLLACALTDAHACVRYNILNALNTPQLNMFISLPANLDILFMCIRDERIEIRELSASIISRLSVSSSAYALPFMRKLLIQLLTEVEIYPEIVEKEASLRLVGHLLSYTPTLVNLYAQLLLEHLYKKLIDHRSDLRFVSSVVTIVGQLASQALPDSVEYFDKMIPFLLESMQDIYYMQLKHTSLWALGQIVASTGYVVEPYRKYPILLKILFYFLQNETCMQVRRETMRILGLLGAIDPFEYNRNAMLKSVVDIEEIKIDAQDTSNKNLPISLDPNEMLTSMSNFSLDDYYPALAISFLMNIVKNAIGINPRRDAIHALVVAMRILDTRSVTYVGLVIPPLLDLMKSMDDNLVRNIISQLGHLVSYIKRNIEPFIPSILNAVEYYWDATEKQQIVITMIDLIQSIVTVMDVEYKKYLPQTLPLVLKKMQREINSKRPTNVQKLLHLIRSCSSCIQFYSHLILTHFTEYLSNESLELPIKQEIMYTIYTFAKQITLTDNCATLFHSFVKIFDKYLPISNGLPNTTTTTLTSSASSASLVSSSVSISNPQKQTGPFSLPVSLRGDKLSGNTDIILLTLETIYLLAKQMGDKFAIYIPMLDRHLYKNKHYGKLYDQLISYCKDAICINVCNAHLSTDFFSTMTITSNEIVTTSTTPLRKTAQNRSTEPQIQRQNMSTSAVLEFSNIRVRFERAEHIATRDGWRASFRQFMAAILQEVPVPIMRVCNLLSHESIPSDIFNACFISIWTNLSEAEQNEVEAYLIQALRNSETPDIFKSILNLAEFMERCEKRFKIDQRLLADKAFSIRAYAKSLHYVEEQFRSVPQPTSDILEQLVSLNHELQRNEAAAGVLDYASKNLKHLDMRVKERWYEKLHDWQKALNAYEKELNLEQPAALSAASANPTSFQTDPKTLNSIKLELLFGKMRCLKGLGDWSKLNYSCKDMLNCISQLSVTKEDPANDISSLAVSWPYYSFLSPSISSASIPLVAASRTSRRQLNTSANKEQQLHITQQQQLNLIAKIAEMGAAAAWGLSDWDGMDNYVKYIPEKSYEGSLYRAIVSIDKNEFEKARDYIRDTRDLLDNDLTSMASQSYDRAYQAIIEAQVLSELEEIITYKTQPGKQEMLRDAWWKRLQGCEKSVEFWHRLLLVRSIVLPKEKNIKPWLKFSSLCQKTGHLNLSGQILNSLLNECGGVDAQPANTVGNRSLNISSSTDFEQCKYAYLKYNWANNFKKEAYAQLTEFVVHNLEVQHRELKNIANAPPAAIAATNVSPREYAEKRVELEKLLSKCYHKLGRWQHELDGLNDATIAQIISNYEAAKKYNEGGYKAWNAWAYANYEAIQFYKNNPALSRQSSRNSGSGLGPGAMFSIGSSPSFMTQLSTAANGESNLNQYIKPAIDGFINCIKLSTGTALQETNCLQDTLRLLTLWFDYCNSLDLYDVLSDGINSTPIEIWLQVIPQLIARIDTNKQYVAKLIHKLLIDLGRIHPQALVYRLILASKSPNTAGSSASSAVAFTSSLSNNQSARNLAAQKILASLREHSNVLVEQAKLVSEELIRVAILWHELWHESLEDASKLYFAERNVKGMFDTLEVLHNMMDKGATTAKETAFLQAYGRDLNEAREFCNRYRQTRNARELEFAWDKYYQVFKKITRQLPQMVTLELSFVSPKLIISKELELAVPGTYEPNKPLIKIKSFNQNIQVIASKQRPRKISIYGSNGREYVFLLKGHEDLRQDERVMQIFGLVNNLLLKNHETARRDLAIQRYSVIPLSQNSGLLEWLMNCDTLHSLIREYRDRTKMVLNFEHRIITRLAPDYEHLTLIQKVEIFEAALDNSSGNDLAHILWLKSSTAEKWLERRTNYTRSLAVMSMVGYVLGLGDRHPSNLMLDRTNGKIIHVDFGDCFETAMTREKFPEKIPFRLTRMLKNAMEVTGIEGTFRHTCEAVMKVLRLNRESLVAVLEAFVYDPLFSWRLVEGNNPAHPGGATHIDTTTPNSVADQTLVASNSQILSDSDQYRALNTSQVIDDSGEEVNRKALKLINRVKDKLTGHDFGKNQIDERTQVDLLIKQATSAENLCQCFIGWCAWW